MTDVVEATRTRGSWRERAREAAAVAARFADEVDRDGRFPTEAIDEIRRQGLLALSIPVESGGEGLTVVELSSVMTMLGEACSSTAMIFAMPHAQVLSLARHAGGRSAAAVATTLARVVDHGALVASATTELSTGGDTGTSGCAVVDNENGTVSLTKTTPVISYGRYAEVVLVTAHRTPDSPASDQVFVICPADSTLLEQTGQWNTLGMRGTSSPGFELAAVVPADHVLDVDFATISAETMLPVSHVLWAAVWFGMARSANEKARRVVRKAARKSIGSTPPGAQRLAELQLMMQSFADIVDQAGRRFDEIADDRDALTTIAFSLSMNGLKITTSELVIEVVTKAMLIAGISGYRNDSDLSLGRVLRDAHGTVVMVNNDRILAHNAQLALMQRGKD